jgi:hypothetical protein
LETDALPIELLAYVDLNPGASPPDSLHATFYLLSRCAVCFRQCRQYFWNSKRSVVFRRFFVVL